MNRNIRFDPIQRSESFFVGALLSLAGGFLDAYTYITRGGVFANAQTGNMVLLGLRLSEHRWSDSLSYLIPILAFAAGVLLAAVPAARIELPQAVLHDVVLQRRDLLRHFARPLAGEDH